jgi:hypothetical protein
LRLPASESTAATGLKTNVRTDSTGDVTRRKSPWKGFSKPVWPMTASSIARPTIVATHHVYREKISMSYPGDAPRC